MSCGKLISELSAYVEYEDMEKALNPCYIAGETLEFIVS